MDQVHAHFSHDIFILTYIEDRCHLCLVTATKPNLQATCVIHKVSVGTRWLIGSYDYYYIPIFVVINAKYP